MFSLGAIARWADSRMRLACAINEVHGLRWQLADERKRHAEAAVNVQSLRVQFELALETIDMLRGRLAESERDRRKAEEFVGALSRWHDACVDDPYELEGE